MAELSEEKIETIKEAFNIIDTDKDGKIASKEIGDLLKSAGLTNSESDIMDYSKELEEEGTTAIDIIDFIKLYNSRLKDTESEDDIKEAFGLFDKDSDGFITKEEFAKALLSINEKLSEEEIEDIIKEADADGDGKISIVEFRRLMKAK